MGRAWRFAAACVGGLFVHRAQSASHMDVAAQDSCLEYKRGEEQDEQSAHAAAVLHAVAPGF